MRGVGGGALAIAAGLLLAGCGGGGHHKPQPVSQRSPSLARGQYIDTHPPTPDYTVVLGVVALPTAPKSAVLQTAVWDSPDRSTRLFSKTGLLSQRVQIGLGTPCPGQRPPDGPAQS